MLLNVGAALFVAERVSQVREGIALAAQAIESGAARRRLEHMVEVSHTEVSA